MAPIDRYSSMIRSLCASHRVKRLSAFGSVLTNRFSADSDIDLLVDFEPLDADQYANNYFSLKFLLEDLLHRSVDLLEESEIKNPYLKQAIEKQRQLIYGRGD